MLDPAPAATTGTNSKPATGQLAGKWTESSFSNFIVPAAGIELMDGNGEGGQSHAKTDKEGRNRVLRVDGERILRGWRGSSPWPPQCVDGDEWEWILFVQLFRDALLGQGDGGAGWRIRRQRCYEFNPG